MKDHQEDLQKRFDLLRGPDPYITKERFIEELETRNQWFKEHAQ